MSLWRDGLVLGEVIVPGAIPARPDCRLYVGTFGSGDPCTTTTGSGALPAHLDDVRVYSRSLSATEVQSLFREDGFSP